MDHPLPVGGAEPGGDVRGDVRGPVGVQATLGLEQLGQGAAVDELLDDEVLPALLEVVVDPDDVGVRELGRGLGLAAEALDERRVGGVLGGQALHRHRTVEELVLGQEDLGHPPLADRLLEDVTTAVDDGFIRAGHGATG